MGLEQVDELIINPHALIHGLTADEIEAAWNNFAARQHRGAPNEGEIVAIGFDASGRAVEMVAIEGVFGIMVIHALTPPTEKVIRELGLTRRQAWQRS